MIVKDEAEDIERCLASVKPYVDYFLIADTGSTDGTPDIIIKAMEGVKGEVVFHDWVNFGHNRDKILQRAYNNPDIDYCLMIDADEELKVEDPSVFDNLTADCYYIDKLQGNIRYGVPALINIKNVVWHWKGVVHNYLTGSNKHETLSGVTILPRSGKGGKSHGVSQRIKYLRDAIMLEQELEKNPNDARSRFYLAQSYRDCGENELAYKNYKERIRLGGWEEEVYCSMLEAARCKRKFGATFPMEEFLQAYNFRPTRSEAIFEIAMYLKLAKQYHAAYMFAKLGASIPPPTDALFVNKSIEDWRMIDELSVCAYWIGKYRESEALCDKLLTEGKLPDSEVARVKKNRDFTIKKLEKDSKYYNEVFKKSADMSRYEDIYRKAASWAVGKVLDIGCGTAEIAKYIENYSGFDFSTEAIKLAETDKIKVANAYTYNYAGYDTYIALEVLEHLDDIAVIKRIPAGKFIVFSVPSFADAAHIRTYTEIMMRDRYSKLINIMEIVQFNWSGKWTEGDEDTQAYILLTRGVRLPDDTR